MFLNAFEMAFDEWFNKEYSWIDINNPKYLETYREEVKKFSSFLVTEYVDNGKTIDYWFNRSVNRD
jgi:hypothetical protein